MTPKCKDLGLFIIFQISVMSGEKWTPSTHHRHISFGHALLKLCFSLLSIRKQGHLETRTNCVFNMCLNNCQIVCVNPALHLTVSRSSSRMIGSLVLSHRRRDLSWDDDTMWSPFGLMVRHQTSRWWPYKAERKAKCQPGSVQSL